MAMIFNGKLEEELHSIGKPDYHCRANFSTQTGYWAANKFHQDVNEGKI